LKKYGKLSKGYNKVNPSIFNMSRQTYFGSLENSPLTMEKQWSHITQEWSRYVTIVKQQHKLDEVSYHKLFDILKQYQKEVNELRAERIARNANLLALVATTQPTQDPYYQTPKSNKSYAPTSKPSYPTRSHATIKNKGKEIAKPITPPFESAFEKDSDPKQARRDKDMQKNLALIAKFFKKIYKPTNNTLRTSLKSRNKSVDTTPSFSTARNLVILLRNVGSQKRLKTPYANEEIDEQELEAHYSYMAKIQEVPIADSGTDFEPLEQDDSNVIPDSPDMCDNDIQNDQNAKEYDDERVALANLKLDSIKKSKHDTCSGID
nr:hypothetical protein [Tanacetum cinerariifolium]